MLRRFSPPPTLLIALALAGCQASPLAPEAGLTLAPKAAAKAPSDVLLQPRVQGIRSAAEAAGQAMVKARVMIKDLTPVRREFGLLTLPAAWQSVRVTLFSPTAMTGAPHALTLPDTAFSPTVAPEPAGVGADANFPPLVPAADYRAECFLTNSAGDIVTARLAGSETQVLNLAAGANTIFFEVGVNGDEASYSLLQASSGAGNRLNVLDYDSYTISTIAGGGADTGNTVANPLSAKLNGPKDIAWGRDGTIMFTDARRIYKVEGYGAGPLTVIGGSAAAAGSTGDGGPALSATFSGPRGLAIDAQDNILVAGGENHRIRKISPDGTVTGFCGTGEQAYLEDAVPPIVAKFSVPTGIMNDGLGNLIITDYGNSRIRKISLATGATTLLAGAGGGGSSDNADPLLARFNGPTCIQYDHQGNLIVADQSAHRIRRIDKTTGAVTTIAGTGVQSFSGDGGPATAATFFNPRGMVFDPLGNFIVVDRGNNRIRRIGTDGIIHTIAGGGASTTEGVLATTAALNSPSGLMIDAEGAIYFTENGTNRIRKLTPAQGVASVTAGDTISFATGLQANQPGVSYMLVKLSGECYTEPTQPVVIRRFDVATEGGTWNQFDWNTGVDRTTGGANFEAAKLVGAADQTFKNGQLDFEAYDRYDQLVGKASLTFKLAARVGDASGNVGIYVH